MDTVEGLKMKMIVFLLFYGKNLNLCLFLKLESQTIDEVTRIF